MNRTRSRALALTTAPLALGMAVALVAAPAQASSTSKKDPAGDHVTGSAATLDLAKVSMRTKGKKKIQVTFDLHNDVTAERPRPSRRDGCQFRRREEDHAVRAGVSRVTG